MKKILVTGAKGFLGSNAVKHFKALRYETYGIGHGIFSQDDLKMIGLDHWKNSDISSNVISEFQQNFDIIIHCAGSGSVGYSMKNIDEDFKKTVDGTYEVLEYMRECKSKAHLIYPSSPAVQGEHPDQPIKENYIGVPASPYGYHKKIAEDLCKSYSKEFQLNISIVRLFSLYGNGLRKQLLWDACDMIANAKDEVIFWGTGEETRDFIHISDVLSLFNILVNKKEKLHIVNGGTGTKNRIKKVVETIRDLINPNISINFNKKVNKGNPKYYCADIQKIENYGFKANKIFNQEIKNYVKWVKNLDD